MTELIGYRKTYRLRIAIPGRKSIAVTFPYEVVEREARTRKLSIDEFLNRFQAVCEYDGFDGVLYKFEPIQKEEAGGGKQG